MNAETLLKWCVAAIVTIVFYRKVIKPFIAKALELKTEEPIEEKPLIIFDEEDIAISDNSGEIRKKINRSLKPSDADQIERMKYDALLARLRKITEENPDASSDTIETLLRETTKGSGA
jgi:flagellar biosynthesis/type III secretory pathway M-ring protein FliF/YscJ